MGNQTSISNSISKYNSDVNLYFDIHQFLMNEPKTKGTRTMMFGKEISQLAFSWSNNPIITPTLITLNDNYYYCNGSNIKCDSLRTMYAIVKNEKAYLEDIK